MATQKENSEGREVINSKTELRTSYFRFPHDTRELRASLGIPEPVSVGAPSVDFLQWFEEDISLGASNADIKQLISSRLSINPYLEDTMAELTTGSDSFMMHSWNYPAIEVTGNFQVQPIDPKPSGPVLLEIPSLKGVEQWAKHKDNYLRQRLAGILFVDELEKAMIERFKECLMTSVCASFEPRFVIDPKKVASTRFNFLDGYIPMTPQRDDPLSVNRERHVAGVSGSFAVLRMQFQIS